MVRENERDWSDKVAHKQIYKLRRFFKRSFVTKFAGNNYTDFSPTICFISM